MGTNGSIAGSNVEPTLKAMTRRGLPALVGVVAVVFSALYFVSDVIEFAQGGFSTLQLGLTDAAEAAIPLFVLGLYAVQRPQIGRLGLVAAVGYAYTFVFFTSTVVVALVDRTSDWDTLQQQFGIWITVHSVLMIVTGVMLGAAVFRAQVLPRWTGITLIVGMVLMAVTSALPDVTRTLSAGVRDLAFAGMGMSLLQVRLRRAASPPQLGEPANRDRSAQARWSLRPDHPRTAQAPRPPADARRVDHCNRR
jgi:Ca2+/Na+ antiporter